MSEAHPGPPTPDAEHALLKPFEGKFRAVVKLFFGPGDPMVHEGTMNSSFQLGGLYLFQDYVGDPSPGPWPAFLGQGFWGYNFGTKKYEGFWIDNASSMMQMETGTVDATGKVWTMLSTFTDPQSAKEVRKRTEIRLIDHNTHDMTTWMTDDSGHEVRTMEILYRRA
jgi:hypothetical protein